MPMSDDERGKWLEAAKRATDAQTKRLIEAYGSEPSDDLRRVLRWIAFNAPVADVRVLATAFEEVAGSSFADGYRDGLESATLTVDERLAHENDLGLDEDER